MKHVEGKTAGVKIGQQRQREEKNLPSQGRRTVDPYRLFEENRTLAYGALHRYFPLFAADEDVKQLACLGLWRACCSYDPGRGSFSTLAYRMVRGEVLEYLRTQGSQKRRRAEVSMDRPEVLRRLPVSRGRVEWTDMEGFYKALGRGRHAQIVSMRQAGLDNGEIARRLGVARCTVTRDLETIRRIFEEYI